MNSDAIEAAADELVDIRATQRIATDLPPDVRPSNVAEGYAIQQRLIAKLLPAGARPIGYKAACTSPIAQQALEVTAPLFGRLLSHSSYRSGVTLRASDFVHRVIESEFAFRLGADVEPTSRTHTTASIAGYVEAVIPAIEIVDYRYFEWTIGAPQVAADNAIHGAWVSGTPCTEWQHLDLSAAKVFAHCNGELASTGSGAAVLGHPLAVLAWLANELPTVGLRLRAGDVVTTGVTTGVFEVGAGDRVDAEFEGVGSVSVAFI